MCDCDRALALISARLDGVLTTEEAAELVLHLEGCPDCMEAASQLETLHTLLPELLEEVPAGFHDRVMARVAEEQVVPFPAPPVSRPSQKRAWKTWLSTAAVLAVVILGGGSLWHLGGGADSGPQDLAGDVPAPAAAPQMDTGDLPPEGGNGVADVAPQSAPDIQLEIPEIQFFGSDGGSVHPETRGMMDPESAVSPELSQSAEGPGVRSTALTALTEVQAGETVAAQVFPGAALTPLVDDTGAFAGLLIQEAEAAAPLELCRLGLSPNGSYYEFSLEIQAVTEEQNRYAVALDGSAVVALRLVEADGSITDNSVVYLATVGEAQTTP